MIKIIIIINNIIINSISSTASKARDNYLFSPSKVSVPDIPLILYCSNYGTAARHLTFQLYSSGSDI